MSSSYSPDRWRIVEKNSWSKARISSVTILFNIIRERIMPDALEKHDGKVSIGGSNITNLRFADDIGTLAVEEQKLDAPVESLDKTCTKYMMEDQTVTKNPMASRLRSK